MPVAEFFARETYCVLGLNSGTSANGLDWALVRISGNADSPVTEVVTHGEVRFPEEMGKALRKCSLDSQVEMEALVRLDVEFGRWLGSTVAHLSGGVLKDEELDLVASHGQTVGHWPRDLNAGSLQIGDPDQLAKISGVPTVSHFRQGDLAVGGEGAPLTPAINQMLFDNQKEETGILNLGGIANLTLLSPGSERLPAVGTDCGPANMLLDLASAEFLGAPFDRGGESAAGGTVSEALLSLLKQHRWFEMPMPASCGREEFGEAYYSEMRSAHPDVKGADLLATFCHFTAWCVTRAIERLSVVPGKILVAGGGVSNRALMKALQSALPVDRVVSVEEQGIAPTALEAISFALLGFLYVKRQPLVLQQATGASRPSVLGRLTWP